MTLKSEDGTYPCQLCGQSYKHVGSWNRHRSMCSEKYDIGQMEKHLEELKKKLEEGLISANEYKKNSDALNLKIKERKEKRKYRCMYCRKAFHVRNYCESHARHCAKNDDYITRRKNPELFLKFQCNICSVRFMSPYNFKKHKESCSRLMQYFSWENGKYICKTCQSQYQRTSKAWEHFRLCNTEKLKHKCSVEGCDFRYSQTKWWVRHMNSFHSSDINETKIFENMEGFLKWKQKEERKDFTFFKKISVCKLGPDKTHIYYYCHFRGQQMNRQTKTSRRKSTPIIDYKCPARIKVVKTPNLITAAYVKCHSHPLSVENIKYQYWTPETREKIKNMLRLGYTPQEIRDSFKEYVGEVDGIPLKEHYITTRQISNFRYALSRECNVNTSRRRSKPVNQEMEINGCTGGENIQEIIETDVISNYHNNSESVISHSPGEKSKEEKELLKHQKNSWDGCEVVEDYSAVAIDTDDQFPLNKEDCFPEEGCSEQAKNDSLSFKEDKKDLCRVLLTQLEQLLHNQKINCFISQMYDSLKEIADMAKLIVESNLIEVVKKSTSQDGDSYTIEIVDSGIVANSCSVSVETIKSPSASADCSKEHNFLSSSPHKCGVEETLYDHNEEVVVVNDYSSNVECVSSVQESSFHCVSFEKKLNKPFLTVGPFEINHLELKSLDMSISDDELTLLETVGNDLFQKGGLTDNVVDSFLYLLCLNKTSFEAIESWKAHSIMKGFEEGVKLLKKQTVFIPVNLGHRCVLFVINIPNKKMYVFDSLNINLADEHFEMAGNIMLFLNKTLGFDENMVWKVASPNRTSQIEPHDSGVYLCYYAVQLVKGLSLTQNFNTKEFRKLIYDALVMHGKEYDGMVNVCV